MRALLVGVSNYDSTDIEDLEFVVDDVAAVDRVLSNAGYDVTVQNPALTDQGRLRTAIDKFFRHTAQDERVLLYLSGHGVHFQGQDYLVPSSADPGSADFAGGCLPIDFKAAIEDSSCGDVIVIVDACREGITTSEKAPISQGWSKRKEEAVANRKIAYMYACGPGERARFVRKATESFSVFTRALCRSLNLRAWADTCRNSARRSSITWT